MQCCRQYGHRCVSTMLKDQRERDTSSHRVFSTGEAEFLLCLRGMHCSPEEEREPGIPGRGIPKPHGEKWDHGESRSHLQRKHGRRGRKIKPAGELSPAVKGLDGHTGRWDLLQRPEISKSGPLSESSDWTGKEVSPGIHMAQNLPSPSASFLRSTPLWLMEETSRKWLSCGLVL